MRFLRLPRSFTWLIIGSELRYHWGTKLTMTQGAAGLANKRHRISLAMTTLSALLAFVPIIAFVIFDTVFPFWLICICLILARLAYLDGDKAWRLRQRAQKGATAEARVKVLLQKLPNGWSWEHGHQLDGIGDIDYLLKAPDGRTIVVEVKSHEGDVVLDGDKLYRCHGTAIKPFEKDFLSQTMRQGMALKEKRGLKWVTLILVFTSAKVKFIERKQRGVYVLQSDELLRVLDLLSCADCHHEDHTWHEDPQLFLEDNRCAMLASGQSLTFSQPKS